MAYRRRNAWPVVVALVGLGWIASGCSSSSSEAGAVGTSGGRDQAIAVDTSSNAVIIENRSEQPLVDVRVAINPVGAAAFTTFISKIDGGQKQEVPLSDFRSADGRTFNRMFVRPKNVAVNADDLTGHKHEANVAWH